MKPQRGENGNTWWYGENSKKRSLKKLKWGQEGEMTQVLYAHMNNKTIKI
jgi:hypothetical protein